MPDFLLTDAKAADIIATIFKEDVTMIYLINNCVKMNQQQQPSVDVGSGLVLLRF